jgi:hypothetical protein
MPRRPQLPAIRPHRLSNGRNGRKVRQTERLATRLAETVGLIVAKHSDPGRILELYYWSRESALFPALRALMQLRPDARTRLLSFLSAASAPQAIHASVDDDGGRLTLHLSRPNGHRLIHGTAHNNENRKLTGHAMADVQVSRQA